MLDIQIDISRVTASLPLKDPLRYGSHSGVMTFLDKFQSLRELLIVIPYLRWPIDAGSIRKVSSPVDPQ